MSDSHDASVLNDDDVLSGIINLLMRTDANVQQLIELLPEEDDDEEADA